MQLNLKKGPLLSSPTLTCGWVCLAVISDKIYYSENASDFVYPLTALDKKIILARYGLIATELPLVLSNFVNYTGVYILDGINASGIPHSILVYAPEDEMTTHVYDPETGTWTDCLPTRFFITTILHIEDSSALRTSYETK